MKSIYEKEVQEEIFRRTKTLKPYSERLWGKMSVEQEGKRKTRVAKEKAQRK